MILKLKKIIVLLILLLAFIITVTPILVESIIIIIAGFFAFFILINEKLKLKIFIKTYFPLLLFYFILIIGLMYSENLLKGFNQLEKKLSFIILPIIIYSVRDNISTKKVIKYFSFGVFFAVIVCDLLAIVKFQSLFVGYSILLQPLDLDPTYFSLYCLFALAFFSQELLQASNLKQRLVYVGVIVYLTYFFLRVGSKTGLILMFILIIYALILTLKNKSKKNNIILILVIISLGLLSYFLPITYNRFYAPLINNNLDFYQLRMNFFNERYYTWKCSIESINIKSIWLGYGTGDDIGVLKNCYESYRRSYVLNSHNIYFSSLLKNGIIGLLSLVFIIIQGFKSNKIQYIIFSLIVLFTGLTESILERQKGVIFFALICTLILTEIQLKREKKCAAL